MNNTNLLLRMMEQPGQYTAAEWQEILADDECRALYMMMSKTQSAIDATRADEAITDDMIESEWQRLLGMEEPKNERMEDLQAANQNFNSSIFQLFNSYRKLAAAFIGILFVSGITLAAIHIVQHSDNKLTQTNTKPVEIPVNPMQNQPTAESDSLALPQPRLYDNVPLEQILTDFSAYYSIKVTYRDDAARQLRLFYQWKPEYTLEKVIEMLNNFESLQLQLDGDTLFVSSTIDARP